MTPVAAVNHWFSQRMQRWIAARRPAVTQIRLDRRNIFILPTGPGLLFLAASTLIFITAINYILSMAFGLAFLMVSVFLLSILYTFRNLQHLSLRRLPAEPVFAGQEAAFVVLLQRDGERAHEMLELAFPGQRVSHANLLDNAEARVPLYLPAPQRGVLKAPRLRVQTRFPLGLWRAWSYVDLSLQCIVFPTPVAGPLAGHVNASASGKSETTVAGTEDFHGLRQYQPGDSLKQVAWKSYARGQGLQVKLFVDHADDRLMLDWAMFPGLEPEERLSRLCHWVLELDRGGIDYGLRLPGVEIDMARGDEHRLRVLTALALWNAHKGAGP